MANDDPSERNRRRLIARGKAAGLVEWQPSPEELIEIARDIGATKIGIDAGTGKATIRIDGKDEDG